MRTYFLDKQFLSDREYAQLERSFQEAGEEILFRDWTSSQQVIDGAKDADAIILMAVQITGDVMDAMPNLKFIGRCGVWPGCGRTGTGWGKAGTWRGVAGRGCRRHLSVSA